MTDDSTPRVPHQEIGEAAIVIGTIGFTIGYIANSRSLGIVGLAAVGTGLMVLVAKQVTSR